MANEYQSDIDGDSDGSQGNQSFTGRIFSLGKQPRHSGRSQGNRRRPATADGDGEEEAREIAFTAPKQVTRGRKSSKFTSGQQAGSGLIALVSSAVALNFGDIWQYQPPECDAIAIAATPIVARLPIPEGQGNLAVEILGLLAAVGAPGLARYVMVMKAKKAGMAITRKPGNAPTQNVNSRNGIPHKDDSEGVLFRENGFGQNNDGQTFVDPISLLSSFGPEA